MSDQEVNQAKLQQCVDDMKNEIKEIKTDIRDGFAEVKAYLASNHEKNKATFAGKDVVEIYQKGTNEKIEKLEGFISKVMWTSVVAILGFIAQIILLLVGKHL